MQQERSPKTPPSCSRTSLTSYFLLLLWAAADVPGHIGAAYYIATVDTGVTVCIGFLAQPGWGERRRAESEGITAARAGCALCVRVRGDT
jgi:hypothetical protein